MVLVSHVHRFIYTKNAKAASTSIEDYFIPYCMSPGLKPTPIVIDNMPDAIAEWVGVEGIVGARPKLPESIWYNHMPLAEVRGRLGSKVYNDYLKFCVVRNPYDRVVSRFFYRQDSAIRSTLKEMNFSDVRRLFRSFLEESSGHQFSLGAYAIKGELSVDVWLRYEDLLGDLERICRRLRLPFEPLRLGRSKSEFRTRPEPFWEYYDKEGRGMVANACAFDVEHFGYQCAEGAA